MYLLPPYFQLSFFHSASGSLICLVHFFLKTIFGQNLFHTLYNHNLRSDIHLKTHKHLTKRDGSTRYRKFSLFLRHHQKRDIKVNVNIAACVFSGFSNNCLCNPSNHTWRPSPGNYPPLPSPPSIHPWHNQSSEIICQMSIPKVFVNL